MKRINSNNQTFLYHVRKLKQLSCTFSLTEYLLLLQSKLSTVWLTVKSLITPELMSVCSNQVTPSPKRMNTFNRYYHIYLLYISNLLKN